MRFVFGMVCKSHKVLASMLLIFNFLAISLVWSAGQQVDVWAFLLFNLRGKRPVWLDQNDESHLRRSAAALAQLAVALILFLAKLPVGDV